MVVGVTVTSCCGRDRRLGDTLDVVSTLPRGDTVSDCLGTVLRLVHPVRGGTGDTRCLTSTFVLSLAGVPVTGGSTRLVTRSEAGVVGTTFRK